MIQGTAAESKLSLDGRVFCANCGCQMRNTGRRYYCPNTTVESGGQCVTSPLDAQYLLRSIVTRMVSRLATEDTVESVTQAIGDSTRESTRMQRGRMDEAEAAIARARRTTVPEADEHGAKVHGQWTEGLTGFDVATAGLAYESMVARNELEKLEFIGDEVALRECLKNPETYMGADDPEDAQELLNLVVRKVTVDNGRATILVLLGQTPLKTSSAVPHQVPFRQLPLPSGPSERNQYA